MAREQGTGKEALMRALLVWLLFFATAFLEGAFAEDVVRPRRAAADLPPAWQAVSPANRLAAKRVAEVDADRKLVERIYGLRINADTYVLDLAQLDENVRAAVEHEIKGIRDRDVVYMDELMVQVVREVTVREVIETLKKTVRRSQGNPAVKVEELEKISQETRDTELAALGFGAIPDSRGHRMVLAERAAEVDAYKKLAARVAGIQLNATTRVGDLVVAGDEIAEHLAATLKGARITDIVFADDDTCQVSMQITIKEVVETVESACKRYNQGGEVTKEEWRKISEDVRKRVLEVIGEGAPREEPPEAGDDAVSESVKTIQRVVRREIGALD